MAITYRQTKGSELTYAELDANFETLDKRTKYIFTKNISTDLTLNASDLTNFVIVLSGNPSTDVVVVTAPDYQSYKILNSVSPAKTIYLKTSTQIGSVPLYPGEFTSIYIDTNNVMFFDNKTSAFNPGTRLVFAQASAPVAWVQDTTISDRMLRIVGDGTGGGTGGTDSPILMNVVPSHTHTFNGVSMGTHTHTFTGAALPNHTHTDSGHSHVVPTNQILRVFDSNLIQLNTNIVGGALQSDSTLSGTANISSNSAGTPSGTNSSVSAGTPNGTISPNSGATNWTPKYYNAIVCTKV